MSEKPENLYLKTIFVIIQIIQIELRNYLLYEITYVDIEIDHHQKNHLPSVLQYFGLKMVISVQNNYSGDGLQENIIKF